MGTKKAKTQRVEVVKAGRLNVAYVQSLIAQALEAQQDGMIAIERAETILVRAHAELEKAVRS